MRSPDTPRGRPGHHPGPASANSISHQAPRPDYGNSSRSGRRRAPLAWFSQHPPAGRRQGWLQFVVRCPRCGGAHVHRSPKPVRGGWRTGSCGLRYLLTPIRPSRIPRQRRTEQLDLAVS